MSELHAAVEAAIDAIAGRLAGLSHAVHDAAELGFAEHKSVRHVAGLLAEQGHDPQAGVYGLDTALRCQAGAGAPRVAVLAEYDALPGVGHGCGHNIICASAVGAFLGLATQIGRLGGSVVLLGTPAEENGSGKELLAQAGAFDDIDAVVMLHPYAGPDVAEFTSLGCRGVYVTYRGLPSHASDSPEKGRNALDAVVAAYQGVAMLRQHMPRTDRIHGIITDGGQAVNVVPEVARGVFMVRAADAAGLMDLSRRVQAILEGAASITGTRLEPEWDPVPPYLPVRSNAPLARRYAAHLTARGHRLAEPEELSGRAGGSTDLGNISLRRPSIHPMLGVAAPEGVSMHTAQFAAAAVTPEADRAMVDGAVALALTAAEFLADPALREQVRADFEASGGTVDVPALLEQGRMGGAR